MVQTKATHKRQKFGSSGREWRGEVDVEVTSYYDSAVFG